MLTWPIITALLLGLLLSLLPLISAAALLVPFVAVLILIEPLLGVALVLLVGPWGALENVVLGPRLLDSGQILFFVTVAAWLARGATLRRITIPVNRLLVPLAAFLFTGALSLLRAPAPMTGLIELFKWVEIGVVMLIVVDRGSVLQSPARGGAVGFLISKGGWRLILLVILCGAASQALIGIWQFGLRDTGPEHFQIIGGRFYRAYGTFEQPNPFGGFMAWMVFLVLGTAVGEVIGRKRARTTNSVRLVWLAFLASTIIVTTLALLFSWSRGAWLGFAVAAGVFLLFWPRRLRTGAMVLTGAILLGLFVWQSNLLPSTITGRVAGFTQDLRFGDVRGVDINDANYSVLERLAHWQAALDMAKYNLWTGIGLGNYGAAYADYALINWPDALGHAHNYYLNILAETGVPGLLAYIIFWLAVFWQTGRVVRSSDWPERGLALGLLAAWTALTVHHLLDKLYVNNLYLYIGAMLGILQVLSERSRSKV